ncbi:MAG: GNAT family N-acetyltransferase [Actinobacteria bacterium 13_2_20CM_2_71_6]|nr:MAG: GNAT family N-acetyltransferase [Actinobacteria bacterium 13_2_20CM_2_71_6]
MEPIEIIAEDLLIRPWQPDDADAVYRACQDPDIQRWTTIPAPYGRAEAQRFVAEFTPAAWDAGTAAPLGVFDLASGELLGSNGLGSTNPARNSAELGYWTAPWARGKGVALTATRAVATWAFAHFGLNRVTWSAEIGNHASRLVALRAGFQIGGEQRMAQPHLHGRRESWVGSLLPGEVTGQTPERYATGSLVARRAAIFGRPVPALPLTGVAGRLRGWRDEDIPPVTEACRDPESVRWTTIPTPYDTADAEYYTRDHVPGQWARGTGAGFAIADAQDRYVGSIDLRLDQSDEHVGEIGFLVAPWARGRGYASAAVRTLCGWGFDVLGLERIVWLAYLGNDGSRRVAEKAGFTIEGVGRGVCVQRGRRLDAWVGALLASDPRSSDKIAVSST